jgi:hypothetical protein
MSTRRTTIRRAAAAALLIAMYTATAYILAPAALAAFATSTLRAVQVDDAGYVFGDGDRYVVVGQRGSTHLSVYDTLKRERRVRSVAADCFLQEGQGQRAVGGGAALLQCSKTTELLRLSDGQITALPSDLTAQGVDTPASFLYVGRYWLQGNGECRGLECDYYLNKRTGEVRIGNVEEPRDVDSSSLSVLKACQPFGNVSLDPAQKLSSERYVLRFLDPARDKHRVVLSRCGGGSRTLDRAGARSAKSGQLSRTLATWSRGSAVFAHVLANGRTYRWLVPGRRAASGQTPLIVPAHGGVYIGAPQSVDRVGQSTKLRLYRASTAGGH